MKTIAIILAAGSGRRFGASEPKQYLRLGHQTVLEHAVEAFLRHPLIDEVAIVVHRDYMQDVSELVRKNEWTKVHHVIEGGNERTDSTRAALRLYAREYCHLLFHDAARPLVTADIITRVCRSLEKYAAVGVAQPVVDTIVQHRDNLLRGTLNRAALRGLQTPQGFHSSTLNAAYEKAAADPDHWTATDDCSLVYHYLPDVPVALVEGAPCNMKLTSPDDLPQLERFLAANRLAQAGENQRSSANQTASTPSPQPVADADPVLAHNQRNLRAMQLRILDILRATADLCDRHQIPYWLDSGTLLGAVRHGGFIPWDDDIDICVPKEYLPKLIEAARTDLPEGLYLQCPETDPSIRQPMYKVRDRHSYIVEAGDDFSRPYGKGLFVDIFPMEAWPTFGPQFSRKVARGYCRANAILHSQHYYTLRAAAEFFYFTAKRACCRALWTVGGVLRKKDRYYSNILAHSGNGNRHLRTTIFPLGTITFEGQTFSAPADADTYLRDLFRDYMQLPPEDQRKGHAVFYVPEL